MSSGAIDILLVEDNPDDAELTVRSLGKHNLARRLHVAKDGQEALDFLAAADAPRVIFLDLKLPRVDGFEVLRRLKSDEKTRAIPVVVLTSSTEDEDVVASYRLGANSYVVKPVDFVKFARSVADLGLYWLLLNKPPA